MSLPPCIALCLAAEESLFRQESVHTNIHFAAGNLFCNLGLVAQADLPGVGHLRQEAVVITGAEADPPAPAVKDHPRDDYQGDPG